ncbi:MAG: S-layer homology domain-containing protein [Candidatus Riflebacteria bacterium]|nr:S-layer homology domain-containing protein [Candidatus Riflebacteria bacterium]
METRKKSFFYGTLAALFITAISLNLTNLEAISQKFNFATLNPEVRMCVDLGITTMQEVRKGNLDSPVDSFSYGMLLKRTLQMLGTSAGTNLNEFAKSKIFPGYYSRNLLARSESVEILSRAVNYLAQSHKINVNPSQINGFSDFRPSKSNHKAFSWLVENSVVRGYNDGRLGAGRKLTRREAYCLVYRLYEQAAREMTKKYQGMEIVFVDIPVDHEFMNTIRSVSKAGGLKYLSIGASFDGNRAMMKKNFSDMLRGISEKTLGNKVDVTFDGKAYLTRIELAMVAEKLLPEKSSYVVNQSLSNHSTYTDVVHNSTEGKALKKLEANGIVLGYADGNLRGNERVSWFETFGVVASVLKLHGIVERPGQDILPAEKADFEKFAKVLKTKRAKVRAILRRS